jgi:hypothetical protein
MMDNFLLFQKLIKQRAKSADASYFGHSPFFDIKRKDW